MNTTDRMARVALCEPTVRGERTIKTLTAKQIAEIREGVMERHRLGALRVTRPALVRVTMHRALRDRFAVHVTYEDDRERVYEMIAPWARD